MSIYVPQGETRGAEITAENSHLAGPTLMILHGLQACGEQARNSRRIAPVIEATE